MPRYRSNDGARQVYSTGGGRTPQKKPRDGSEPPGDGVVRVSRTSSGRKGKTVTLVAGLPPADLKSVAKDLKRHCGSGGAVKAGVVEIQG
ncbi:MAG: stress response translation initiation inhibitor YciH, partial [Thermoleophilia bacterium]|nr:stress response translation initiation inhibitor YciH [Thermoleophilia bacterium]